MTKKYRDPNWLQEKYLGCGMTQQEMADEAGCGQHTISRWLREYNIDTRDASDYTPHLKPQWHPKGYIEFRDQSGDTDDRFYHHRLLAVAEYGFGEVKGKDVHHINGLGWDNRPENIELLSQSDHMVEERKIDMENGVKLEERFN